MKKLLLTMVVGLFLVACSSKTESKETETKQTVEETVISAEEAQQIIELDEASDQIIEKTEELNQQLDSLINEI